MAKKNFLTTSPKTILSDKEPKTISEVMVYPYPICLECCNLDVTNGYYTDVLKALKSFSSKEEHERRCPHPLHKDNKLDREFKIAKQLNANQVVSIDVKGRRDSKRLFYCVDKEHGVCKILSLCSEESHK